MPLDRAAITFNLRNCRQMVPLKNQWRHLAATSQIKILKFEKPPLDGATGFCSAIWRRNFKFKDYSFQFCRQMALLNLFWWRHLVAKFQI